MQIHLVNQKFGFLFAKSGSKVFQRLKVECLAACLFWGNKFVTVSPTSFDVQQG
jgi:hypothetical protein